MVFAITAILLGHLCTSMADVRIVTYNDLLFEGAYSFNPEGVDSYRALVHNDTSGQIIVGAKNHIFRLKCETLELIEKLELIPSPTDFRIDEESGKFVMIRGDPLPTDVKGCSPTKPHCQIYINQLHLLGEHLFIFGTSANVSFYQQRSAKSLSAALIPQETRSGNLLKLPNNPGNIHKLPNKPAVAQIAVRDRFFIGSPFDRNRTSADVGITATNLTNPLANPVRTKKDGSWLESPEFVGAFEEGTAVYFVFRELAIEALHPGRDPPVYSRVARICKNDMGGKYPVSKGHFVSFLKARLVCDGHDRVTAIAYNAHQKLLYASFTNEKVESVAVCLFEHSTIEKVFGGGFYHAANNITSIDPRTVNRVEQTCFGPRALDEAMAYHLMSEPVKPLCDKVLYKRTGGRGNVIHTIGFTAKYSEAFLGDFAGRIWNLSISTCEAHPQEVWLLPPQVSVNAISSRDTYLLVLTNLGIISIPFERKQLARAEYYRNIHLSSTSSPKPNRSTTRKGVTSKKPTPEKKVESSSAMRLASVAIFYLLPIIGIAAITVIHIS